MTMLLIGTIMAGADWKTLICKTNVWFAAVRLIGISLVVFVFCLLAKIDMIATGVCRKVRGIHHGVVHGDDSGMVYGDQVCIRIGEGFVLNPGKIL